MAELGKKELLDYAWNYFHIHATQRLTTFNFYLILATLLSTGLIGSYKDDFNYPWIRFALGILLVTVTFVFKKLDIRNSDLIDNAERALIFAERSFSHDIFAREERSSVGGENVVSPIHLFTNEVKQTDSKPNGSLVFWRNYYTYRNCFNILFVAFGLLGCVISILSILELISVK